MRPQTKIEQYLAVATAGGPTWHPNGGRIAFAYNEPGVYQIYSTKVHKDIALWPKQITFEQDRSTNPKYMNDGTLIFSRDRGGNEKYQIGLIDTVSEITWLTTSLESRHIITYTSKSGFYFYANLEEKSRLDIYYHKLPLKDNEPELIFRPENGIGLIRTCSPDEKQAIIDLHLSNTHQELILFDLESHESVNLTRSLPGNKQLRWTSIR